jgi:hypothetical protein
LFKRIFQHVHLKIGKSSAGNKPLKLHLWYIVIFIFTLNIINLFNGLGIFWQEISKAHHLAQKKAPGRT